MFKQSPPCICKHPEESWRLDIKWNGPVESALHFSFIIDTRAEWTQLNAPVWGAEATGTAEQLHVVLLEPENSEKLEVTSAVIRNSSENRALMQVALSLAEHSGSTQPCRALREHSALHKYCFTKFILKYIFFRRI